MVYDGTGTSATLLRRVIGSSSHSYHNDNGTILPPRISSTGNDIFIQLTTEYDSIPFSIQFGKSFVPATYQTENLLKFNCRIRHTEAKSNCYQFLLHTLDTRCGTVTCPVGEVCIEGLCRCGDGPTMGGKDGPSCAGKLDTHICNPTSGKCVESTFQLKFLDHKCK